MLTTFARDFAQLMADVTLKATMILLLAVIVAILARRVSAASRHCIWAVTLGCILCLPFLCPSLPALGIRIKPLSAGVYGMPNLLGSAATAASANVSDPPAKTVSTVDPRSTIQPPIPSRNLSMSSVQQFHLARLSWSVWAFLSWLVGVGVVVARFLIGIREVRWHERGSVLVTEEATLVAIASAHDSLNLARMVQVRQAVSAESVSVPMTWGILRPVVLLPFGASQWPIERVRAALLHEMAHIKRSDWLMQVFACAACAVYWFHPLAWLAARKMRAESERSADDLVLAAGMPALAYARHLLDVARSAQSVRGMGVGALAMAQTSQIEGRLRAVLATGAGRRPMSRIWMTAVSTVSGVLLITVARLHFVARAQPASVLVTDVPQLHADFTLRYAATYTDLRTRAMMLNDYTELHDTYQVLLKKNPHFQPVPKEALMPFEYYQHEHSAPRQIVYTISAHGGYFLHQVLEEGHTYTLIYDGRDTHSYGNQREEGRSEPGLTFGSMSNCPLPAVNLPHIPLFKSATIAATSGAGQTWDAQCIEMNSAGYQNALAFSSGMVHATRDMGVWKILDVGGINQSWRFSEHRRFKGLWIGTRMNLTTYATTTRRSEVPHSFPSSQAVMDYFTAHRAPASSCEYTLLSASETPFDAKAYGLNAAK